MSHLTRKGGGKNKQVKGGAYGQDRKTWGSRE